jgi:hypothetical protein
VATTLTGAAIQGRTPEGNADFRSDSRGRTRLNVEVENVNLPSGTVLIVSIQHGATVLPAGAIALSAAAENELDLDSQDGDAIFGCLWFDYDEPGCDDWPLRAAAASTRRRWRGTRCWWRS